MKLLIIDGNSMLNRAYFAMPEWRNRAGEATAGVYGFLSMTLKAIEQVQATHLIVVFDSREGDNFRKALYVGYHSKRGRDEQIEEDIWSQIEKLKIVFEKLAVPVYVTPGCEADDTIGSLCRICTLQEPNLKIVVVTGDKDLMQLVDDQVSLLMPQRAVSDTALVDRDGVKSKLGVWPEQVIDYKALVGDSSDNYPGVAGIGPKTAVTLLEQYQTFERVVHEAHNAKVEAGIEGGKLSQELATIKTDIPLEVHFDEALVPNTERMVEVFKELGHRSLIRRVTGEEVKIDDTQQKLFE